MDTRKHVLLITYLAEIANEEPILVSSNCLPVKAQRFEPAGHAFHAAALKLLGIFEEEGTDSDTRSELSDEKGHTYMASSESYSTKGKKKLSTGSKQKDHYALLGLGHLRFLATEEQIRRSYREAALKYHPDKQAAILLAEETEESKRAKKDEIEDHFKAIQDSYEVLTDNVKRRIYDSTDEFDDEIPADCAPHDFFKVFGPAFMRNGRWSINQPVPSLGDEETPFEELDCFYDFWYAFKSWREFPHADECDVEQAESRDEKRWMERQNLKLREKARKEEHARVRALVENAYKKDPRIIRRKEEEKAEKQKKKEAKHLAKRLQEEEAARIAEQEKRHKEEEDRQVAEAALNQKKQKEKEKKLVRKERSRLRTLCSSVISESLLDLAEDDVEKLCMSFGMEQLKIVCDKLEGKDEAEKARILKQALSGDNFYTTKMKEKNILATDSHDSGPKANGFSGPVKPENSLTSYQKEVQPWGKEEIELLRKGMQKYPKGTSRRWEVICEYMGTGRSVDEILKAMKTVLLQKPDSGRAFDSFLEKRKPAQIISSPLTARDEAEGSAAGVAEIMSSGELIKQPSSNVGDNHNHGGSILLSNGGSLGDEQDIWSDTQERALVQAVKAFPKDTNQRWERIATAVPGKSVSQCKKKFLQLRDNFRNKKNSS